MKKEFKVIADLLPSNTRVLDVGCGDGSLMNLLREEKNINVRSMTDLIYESLMASPVDKEVSIANTALIV